MTKVELEFLNKFINDTKNHSAIAASFDPDHGYIDNHQEAKRLIESEDYRKGWEACHERMKMGLSMLIQNDQKGLKRYIR